MTGDLIRRQKKDCQRRRHTGRKRTYRAISANAQQRCLSALCDAWLLQKKNEIRESSYAKYRTILERHIKPKLGSCCPGELYTASIDAFTRELLDTDRLSVKTVHDILSVLHSVLKDTEARCRLALWRSRSVIRRASAGRCAC